MEQGKIPPQAIEYETAVLGVILTVKNSIERANILQPEFFYLDKHQVIFKSCLDMSAKNNPVDLLSISNDLTEKGKLESVGGISYLAELTMKVSSDANLEYYSTVIFQKYGLRELIKIGINLASESYENPDMFELQNRAVIDIEKLSIKETRDAELLNVIAGNRIKEIKHLQDNDITVTGLNTGWHKLNDITHGWQKSDLIILAARPSQGKSALAVNIAVNVAIQSKPVLFFSLEMSKGQLTDRVIGIKTSIDTQSLKKANLTSMEWQALHTADFNLPILIDDTPALSIQSFKAKVRRHVKQSKVELVIIDYLQLMDAKLKGESREQQIAHISRNLKLIAKEMNIPVIALAQLSREAERRKGYPILSDLRESGAIEQDADMVMFIHDEHSDDKTILVADIELVIAKNRQGSAGVKSFKFWKQYQKFTDYEL